MIAEPKSFKCTIHIQTVEADPDVPEKFYVSGEILSAANEAKDNSFFSSGRTIQGYTFHPPPGLEEGKKITAEVEFMGDPFVQNYQLHNVQVES